MSTTVLPFGFSDDFSFRKSLSLEMKLGDLLVLGTDGVVEVRNDRGEIFGSERLKEVIRDNRRLPAADLLERVKAAVREFHAEAYPADDVTLMILERKLG